MSSDQSCQECASLQREFGLDGPNLPNSQSQASGSINNVGRRIAVAATCGLIVGGTVALLVPFVSPALRRFPLPFVPATDVQLANVAGMLARFGRSGRPLVDLGSGDGRVVTSLMSGGVGPFSHYHGIELNYPLVLFSRYRAWRGGFSGPLCRFERSDLWKVDLSGYANVVVFGVDTMMPLLENKLSQELKPGSCVVACRFPLPSWLPQDTLPAGVDTVWCYKVPPPPTSPSSA